MLYFDKCFEDRLKEQVFGEYGKTNGTLSELRNDRLLSLRSDLSDNNKPFSLVVGAGVSASVGQPGWNRLLGRLEVNSFDLPKNEYSPYPSTELPPFHTMDRFRKAQDHFHVTDTLELAEYIKLSFPATVLTEADKQAVMKTVVRQALEADDSYCDILKNKSTFLFETVELMDRHFSNTGRYVITTNYDNLLEWYYMRSKRAKPEACPIYSGRRPETEKLNVYHIHGFLGLQGTDREGEESEKIILTEDDYKELEQYPYCWENYLLTRALHEGGSLFLGFSGDDYNFRRILRGLPQDKRQDRYILIDVDEIIRSSVQMAIAEEKTDISYMLHILLRWLDIRDSYWSHKGFTPIWATREECPKIIRYLYT